MENSRSYNSRTPLKSTCPAIPASPNRHDRQHSQSFQRRLRHTSVTKYYSTIQLIAFLLLKYISNWHIFLQLFGEKIHFLENKYKVWCKYTQKWCIFSQSVQSGSKVTLTRLRFYMLWLLFASFGEIYDIRCIFMFWLIFTCLELEKLETLYKGIYTYVYII